MSRKPPTEEEIRKHGYAPPPPLPRQDSGRVIAEGGPHPRQESTTTMALPFQVLEAEIGKLTVRNLVQAEEIRQLRGRVAALQLQVEQAKKGQP